MSWATCYSGSNNIHFAFPPIMNDGRNYSSWTADSTMNNQIKRNANITSNWDYRRHLQTNAHEIMKQNTNAACYTLGINPVTLINTETLPSSPFVFKSAQDNQGPPFGYENTDLKNMYLSREQLNARMISPSIYTKNF